MLGGPAAGGGSGDTGKAECPPTRANTKGYPVLVAWAGAIRRKPVKVMWDQGKTFDVTPVTDYPLVQAVALVSTNTAQSWLLTRKMVRAKIHSDTFTTPASLPASRVLRAVSSQRF